MEEEQLSGAATYSNKYDYIWNWISDGSTTSNSVGRLDDDSATFDTAPCGSALSDNALCDNTLRDNTLCDNTLCDNALCDSALYGVDSNSNTAEQSDSGIDVLPQSRWLKLKM